MLMRRTQIEGQVLREFWCPACCCEHAVLLHDENDPATPGSRWTLSGPAEAPSLSPEVIVTWWDQCDQRDACCRFFLKNGQFVYDARSTHKLAGWTIPMMPLPQGG